MTTQHKPIPTTACTQNLQTSFESFQYTQMELMRESNIKVGKETKFRDCINIELQLQQNKHKMPNEALFLLWRRSKYN